MRIISRSDAKALGLKRYFTGKPCKRGHIAERKINCGTCLECHNHNTRKYYHADPQKEMMRVTTHRKNNPKKTKEYYQKYYTDNKDRIKKVHKSYAVNNRKKKLQTQRNYRKNNREKIKELNKIHNSKTKTRLIEFNRRTLRRIIYAIKDDKKIKANTALNYGLDQLKEHIESKFDLFMTWSNYGLWHIDHITPVSHLVELHYDKSQTELLNIINALDNIQPLWRYDNLSKSNKV